MYLWTNRENEWYSFLPAPGNIVPWYWVTDISLQMMSKGYLDPGQTVQERVTEIANTFYSLQRKMGIPQSEAAEYANYLWHMSAWGFNTFATPEWVSYGNDKGLSISCFGSHTGDSMNELGELNAELAMLTKLGGGTSTGLSKIRPRGAPISTGGTADGPVHWAGWINSTMKSARQGEARRGYCAAYLDGHHPDIIDFVKIGTTSSDIHNITTGAVLDDKFMELALVEPEYMERMARIQESRSKIGFPYILFKDNANRARPQVYKDLGAEIEHSNLCAEIMLPNNAEESFVCVLASMNAVHFDLWKDTMAVRVLTRFLDTVVEESIDKIDQLRTKYTSGSDFLKRIQRFLERHRAIGVGITGLHHLYQSKMLSFESADAARLNVQLFRYMQEQTYLESAYLASLIGEPDVLKGYGMRNTTTMAVAPTKSTAAILGSVSESIQPELANVFIKKLAKAAVLIKNPYLEQLLESKGMNTEEVWEDIKNNTGSVQHLTFLTDEEKAVFKTFAEINPRAIIDQAAARQSYIDQGQSLNLIFHPNASSAYINALVYYAWKMGIKSLYYQFNMSAAQALNVNQLNVRDCEACGA